MRLCLWMMFDGSVCVWVCRWCCCVWLVCCVCMCCGRCWCCWRGGDVDVCVMMMRMMMWVMCVLEVILWCVFEGVVVWFVDDDVGEGVLEDAWGARLRIAARVATTAETRRRCEIVCVFGVEIVNVSGDVNVFCDVVWLVLERVFVVMSVWWGVSASAFWSSYLNVASACAVIVGDGVVCLVEFFYEYIFGVCLRLGGNLFVNDVVKVFLVVF